MKTNREMMNEKADVAHTILLQLGGSKFLAMTGARDLVSTSNSLRFRLPRGNTGRVTHVAITLTDADLYDVHFYGSTGTMLVERGGVYADGLVQLFEIITGLRCSL